ncbi:MAG: hypothetical protein ABJJ44_06065 [Paraglaciecola sp.]|uniref:hypothetical protein n=1 Tax=Paraglaciecola sp. TaxID=1920173 RepID=UPI0032971989
MKPKIYHVINPYIVEEGTDDFTVHEKTIQSLLLAREYAENHVDVTFILKVDVEELEYFQKKYTSDFVVVHSFDETSASLDVNFNVPRNLPLLSEIIKLPVGNIERNSHTIFTNMDICLQPFFYCEVVRIIKNGFDCFVINRRTVSKTLLYKPLEEAFIADGDKHIGHDCFVLPSKFIDVFNIKQHILGIGFVFRPFLLNCILHSQSFHEFDDVYMTFHYGDDMEWKSDKYADYLEHNKNLMIEVYADSLSLIELADKQKQEWIKKFFPFDFLPRVDFSHV